jgi:hypothetical protein
MSADRFPKITEKGLDDLRQRIGIKITDSIEPWNYEASRDAIRHYLCGQNEAWQHRRPAQLPFLH